MVAESEIQALLLGYVLQKLFAKERKSGPGRIRTSDTRHRKPLLYPLSYRPAEMEPPINTIARPVPLQRQRDRLPVTVDQHKRKLAG